MMITVFSAFAGLSVTLYGLLRSGTIGLGYVIFGLIVLLARNAIGVWHYLTFLDPAYFTADAPRYAYFWDYEWLDYAATIISSHWIENGLWSLPVDIMQYKNTFLMPYFGALYYFGENRHFLNFSTLNSFHACLVAVIASRFSYVIGGKAIAQTVFVLAMIQPFGFISSVLWRDSVGQFFLLSGAIVIILTSLNARNLPQFLLASISLMLLRNIYFINGIITAAVKILYGKKLSRFAIISGVFVFLALIIVLNRYLFNSVFVYEFSNDNFSYNQGVGTAFYNILTGLVGPFPWTQMLSAGTLGREYQLPDILQGAYNLTLLILLGVSAIEKKINMNSSITLPTLGFVFSIMAGGLVSYGHVPYVTVSSVLLLPLIGGLNVRRFLTWFIGIVFFLFVGGMAWSALRQ